MLYFDKNCEIIFFRILTIVSEKMPKIMSTGLLITEKRPFKKLKNLSILARFISKIKKSDISNFLSVKYFGKRLFFQKTWNVRVNNCANYRPSNLLFWFTGDKIEKLNKRQRHIAVNSLVHYFENEHPKKCLAKFSRFLTQWPFNDGPWKYLQNWTERTFYWHFVLSFLC